MNAYKITVLVLDFDNVGAGNAGRMIETARYPNLCMSPQVLKIESRDIGEWPDNHPRNLRDLALAEIERLLTGEGISALADVPWSVVAQYRARLTDAEIGGIVKSYHTIREVARAVESAVLAKIEDAK